MLRSTTTLPYAFTAPIHFSSTPLATATSEAGLSPAVLPRAPFAHRAPKPSDVSRIYHHLQAVQNVREQHPNLTFQHQNNILHSLMDNESSVIDTSKDVHHEWGLSLASSLRIEELFGNKTTIRELIASIDPELSNVNVASFDIEEQRDNIWSLKITAKFENNKAEHIATYEINYDISRQADGKTMLHKRFCSIDVYLGSGLGKRIIAKSMQFNRDNTRVQTYDFQAKKVGRYAWRNCSLPFDNISRTKVQKALHCLNEMLELEIEDLVIDNIRTPRDVALICDMDEAFEDIVEQVEIISTTYQSKQGFPFKPFSFTETQIDLIAQFPGTLALLMVDGYSVQWTPETKASMPARITL
jgi:hypothetical protein